MDIFYLKIHKRRSYQGSHCIEITGNLSETHGVSFFTELHKNITYFRSVELTTNSVAENLEDLVE